MIVGANVFQAEPFLTWQIVVELHRAELPFAANAIGDDEVRLRAIERGFARLDRHMWQVHGFADRFQSGFGPIPNGRAADILVAFWIAEAEPHAVVVHAQRLQHSLSHLEAAAELV